MDILNFLKEKKFKETQKFLAINLPETIDTGIILGSFLNKSADFLNLKNKIKIPYKKIPNMPIPSVIGHDPALIYGMSDNKNILIFGGRCHLYEGADFADIIYPVSILKSFSAQNIIITNSAGGINPEFHEDDFMLITDQINFMFENPLYGHKYTEKNDYFLDMSSCYNTELIEKTKKAAQKIKMKIVDGIYAGVRGPVLETRSEISMLLKLGADAVGMSTIPEVIMSNFYGLSVLGISHIRNMATGKSRGRLSVLQKNDSKFSHSDGLAKELNIGKKLAQLLEIILKKI